MTQDDLTSRKTELSAAKRALLQRRLRGQTESSAVVDRIVPAEQTGPQPLSYTQQRVWFLQQLYPDNRAYNMSEAWRLRGPLDAARLQAALQNVIDRHGSLRTAFTAPDSEPLQQVVDGVEPVLTASDLSHLPSDEREEAARQLVVAEGNRPFALDQPPLLRAALIRLGDDDHILQLVLHHIITDEWSNDLIWRELAAFMAAGNSPQPPEPPIAYTDYAQWQRDQMTSGKWDGQMHYWQTQLAGDLPVMPLPTDRARPAEQSLRGGTVRRTLPASLLEGIKLLSQQESTTAYTTLLAAFQALLHRYSHQRDVLVGTPIANRQREETTGVVGMFINTVVMRADVSADMTFRQLLTQAKQTALDALANQDLPFDLLVQAMRPERDLSYNPLFQTMFVYFSDSDGRSLSGVTAEPVRVDRGVSKFDLTLFMGEDEGELLAALEYSGDLFDEATAERMMDHWQTLLAGIVAAPDTPVADLPLLSAAESDRVLRAWNDTVMALRDERCIHEMIGEWAVTAPDAEAVITGSERLSYGQLDRRAAKLARRLVDRGVLPGTPVGLYVERSADMVVGILGILKAGGAYVPLEPSYPEERIRFTLHDSGAPLVVAQSKLAGSLPASDAAVLLFDDNAPDGPTDRPLPAVSLDDIAYIIYTSGSTGTPKGVMVTHRNLLASTLAREATYDAPVSRYLLLSSFAFDSSVAGIFWTLVGGGALVLPEPDEEKDVQRLAALIDGEQVTHTLALPTLYRLLLAYAPPGSLNSLQVVIVAGEACPPDLGELHYGLLPDGRLYNEYGPTEATVWCSVYLIPPASEEGPVPIGRPIANSRLYILDSNRRPVPIGVAGELYVGGAGVTPGYWDNPELTGQRFVPVNLDGRSVDDVLYRTGDLAKWRADGELIFLGRVDNQVKIRGFRIELGGIEARLQAFPGVEEAVVTVWEQPGAGGATDKSLVAYVSGKQLRHSAGEIDRQLRAYLASALPDYMVPRLVMKLDSMPHTPNGKIDMARLPEPQIEQNTERPFVAPRTAAETILASIWSDILGLPQVGVEDGFFELGGDSLMSIQAIARARQEGLVITPRQLFREQTIARLAAVAEQADASRPAAAATSGIVPLTPIQRWFFSRDLAQPAHWNQAAWFEAAAGVDLDALQAALNGLAAHHPMLRARYRPDGGVWRQEIAESVRAVDITRILLVGQTPAEQDRELLAAANRLHAGLNLADGPLLRAAWFDLGPDRKPRLLLTIHHLVIDAISWGILAADLVTAYTQSVAGQPLSLPPTPTGYGAWAETLSRLTPDVARREASYWLAAASQASPLPTDGPGSDGNTVGSSGLITVSLDSERTAHLLRDVHHAYHTRIDDILLAALAQTMAEWTGQPTTLISEERHGREDIDPQVDVSRTVGWFTTLFPLALTVPAGADPGPAIRAVKEQVRAVPQNGIGYGMLRYLGDPELQRALAERPQPPILFNYLGVAQQANKTAAPLWRHYEGMGQLYGPENERAHLIDINAQVRDGRLVARWQYGPGQFQEATITAVAEAYITTLARLIDHCLATEQDQHTPSDFPLANLQQDDLDGLSDLLADLE